MIKTIELKKCLHLIGYWLNEDEKSIEFLMNKDLSFSEIGLAFSKELNENLLMIGNTESKKDLIKFYIFEFFELQGFYIQHNEILFTGIRSNYETNSYEHTSENGTKRKLSEFENYVIQSWNLFDLIFNEIQLCCFTFEIDFFEICSNLNFQHNIFSSEIITILKEMRTNNSLQQNLETKTVEDISSFTNNFDNIKPTEIYKHFKAGLVEKGYLTEQELNEYLKAAFELKTKPETLFKLKHTRTKQNIYTVFYVYYKDVSQKKHNRQKEYAALLGDFFEGYNTEIIKTNWARDYKTKR